MALREGQNKLIVLLAGDVFTILLVTLVGFATHGTLGSAGARILTTFFPLLISWLIIAPVVGAYRLEQVRQVRQIWRPVYSMVLAAPLASWMRGLLLNTPILPVFVLVLGAVSTLGILIWRMIFVWWASRVE